MDVRVDWAKSERYTFFVRLTKAWQTDLVPAFFGNGADSNFGGMNPRHQVVIGNTFVPSPTFIVNVLIDPGAGAKCRFRPARDVTPHRSAYRHH